MLPRAKLSGLTPLQAEILKRLFTIHERSPKLHLRGLCPADLGPEARVPHYDSLKRLLSQGYVERVSEPDKSIRHNYRITQAGCDKWLLLRELTALPPQHVLGPPTCLARYRRFADLCTEMKVAA